MSETCSSSHVNNLSPSMQQTPGKPSELVLTLPSDPSLTNLDTGAAILSCTEKKHEWFARGRILCPGLGTLVYLPAEVRCLLWKLSFEYSDTVNPGCWWEYDRTCGAIFDLKAYPFGFGHRGLDVSEGLQSFRSVSSIVKAESEEAFLTFRTFRFHYPDNLDGFLDQLKGVSTEQLRSVDLGICMVYYLKSWMDPLTRLPSSLQEVKFSVYPVELGWYNTARGQNSLVNLGKMVEIVAQSCPNAKISITSTRGEYLAPECRDVADAVLDRLQRQKTSQEALSPDAVR